MATVNHLFSRNRLRQAAWCALLGGITMCAVDGVRLWRDSAINTAINASPLPALEDNGANELRIAHARALAHANEHDRALSIYREVETTGTPLQQEIARFNSGNVYLRQALALMGTDKAPRAVPPLELAKGLYREVLRHNPSAWDARYNLERALRALPEFEDENADTATLSPLGERAVTTMRGVAQGLP